MNSFSTFSVTAFSRGLVSSLSEVYDRLDAGSQCVEAFVRNVVFPVSKVLWSHYLVPTYFVLEAICNWLWDEHLVPMAVEVQADIDAYVAECQEVKPTSVGEFDLGAAPEIGEAVEMFQVAVKRYWQGREVQAA